MQWVSDLDTEDTICELIESIECVCAKIRKKNSVTKKEYKNIYRNDIIAKIVIVKNFQCVFENAMTHWNRLEKYHIM